MTALLQAVALVKALWPILEPLGEDFFKEVEALIAGSRAAATTLPPEPPIAPGVEQDLDAAKKGLDEA